MTPGMIGTSNQRTRLDMAKTEFLRVRLEILELSRGQIAIDLQLLHRRLEILAEGDNVDLILPEIVQRRHDFVPKLSDTEHHPRLRQSSGRIAFARRKSPPMSRNCDRAELSCIGAERFRRCG